MKCDLCEKEGKTAEAYPDVISTSNSDYSPEHGIQVIQYLCPNGHTWVEYVKNVCPTCGTKWK